jgi:uncharacterized protein YndB with AHSA1/START domain
MAASLHAATSIPSLRVTRIVEASRPRVFAAWTKAEEMKHWMAPGELRVANAESDLRVGGTYLIHMRSPQGDDFTVSGVYREVQAPDRVVYTWHWAHDHRTPDMIVTVEFFDRGNRTEIVLTHEGFPNMESRARHEHGWMGCLANLVEAVHA